MDSTPDRSDPEPRSPGDGRPAPGSPAGDRTTGTPAGRGPSGGQDGAPPRPTGIDPRLDERRSRGVTGATWTALLLGLLILVLLLVFILQNDVSTRFEYLGWEFRLPLGVAMLLAAVAGALVMGLVGSVRLFRLGHRIHRLEKEREDIRRALG